MRQYFYRVNSCTVSDSSDPDCICWHDEGTGPLGKMSQFASSWRNKVDRKAVSAMEAAISAAVESERNRCVSIIENYQIPVGNSVAGEKAREMTLNALRNIRDEILEGPE